MLQFLALRSLHDIALTFARYIVLPRRRQRCAGFVDAACLDSGCRRHLALPGAHLADQRCGKTNALIILLYLTPRSELASNISASAIISLHRRCAPDTLIDEADSFREGQ